MRKFAAAPNKCATKLHLIMSCSIGQPKDTVLFTFCMASDSKLRLKFFLDFLNNCQNYGEVIHKSIQTIISKLI